MRTNTENQTIAYKVTILWDNIPKKIKLYLLSV